MKEFQRVKIVLGPYGLDGGIVSEENRLPVELPPGSGGLTDVELRATPIEVTGQVSLDSVPEHAVTVSGAVAVTGTFWQATQPVTGAFWQATQPVSLASVPSHAVTGPITNAELRASPVPVSIGASSAFTFVSTNNAAPAANSVQADTGQLAAGDYELIVNLMVSDTVAVGKGLIIEHRNAANNGNIAILGGASPNGGTVSIQIAKLTLATNERIRVIAGSASGAANSRYVSAIGRRTT